MELFPFTSILFIEQCLGFYVNSSAYSERGSPLSFSTWRAWTRRVEYPSRFEVWKVDETSLLERLGSVKKSKSIGFVNQVASGISSPE